MDALELCNKINMEAESLADSGFPLEVFPQKMQSIIIDMVVHGNFKVDYVAMSMLSAASAALGNTYRIHVKQDWDTNAALYIILVGRPGMGKTPPLQLAYKPIREYERKLFDKFCHELDLYEAACATKESGSKDMKKPILKRVTLDDFTLEALVLEHYNNLRGIAINYDEILGLLANTDRYGKNPMLERLLSIWSGCHLENTRVKNDRPQRVEEPCVNIIGTTQTKRMKELMASKFMDTGFLTVFWLYIPNPRKFHTGWMRKTAMCARARLQENGLTSSGKSLDLTMQGVMTQMNVVQISFIWTRTHTPFSLVGGTEMWMPSMP